MSRKLLLIEDDDTTRELLTLLLGAEGWDVETAATGEEALSRLTDSQPDVILSDLNLPGLSGTPLAQAIRQTHAVPLLAMTATAKAGLPAGFDALLVKPFPPEAVQKTCEALNHTAKPPVTETALSEAMLDEAIFARMSSMPAKQLIALYNFALDDADKRLARMESAVQAVDDTTFRSEAHALKGSAGMIGALQIRSLAAAAEEEGLSETAVVNLSRLSAETANFRHMLKARLPVSEE